MILNVLILWFLQIVCYLKLLKLLILLLVRSAVFPLWWFINSNGQSFLLGAFFSGGYCFLQKAQACQIMDISLQEFLLFICQGFTEFVALDQFLFYFFRILLLYNTLNLDLHLYVAETSALTSQERLFIFHTEPQCQDELPYCFLWQMGSFSTPC